MVRLLIFLLTEFGVWLLSKAGRIILTSLGVGLVSATVSLTLLNQYISYLQNSYSALGEVAGILSLAGVDYGLSIIITAVVIKITLKAGSIRFGKL
jgi:uncharacterized protein YebE (UPF0316 family)